MMLEQVDELLADAEAKIAAMKQNCNCSAVRDNDEIAINH